MSISPMWTDSLNVGFRNEVDVALLSFGSFYPEIPATVEVSRLFVSIPNLRSFVGLLQAQLEAFDRQKEAKRSSTVTPPTP